MRKLDKAMEMGKASASGSLKLSIGLAISTVISAIGTIILARLLLPAEYGLYAIAIIPTAMFSLFRDFGIDSAITKYVVHFRTSSEDETARDIILAGLTFEIIIGIILSLVSFSMANYFASTLFHRPGSSSLISIVSISIFSGGLMTVSNSSFVGAERMGLNSVALILNSIAKTALTLLLVFLGYGVLGAVVGYTFSLLITGFISLALLYFFVFRNLRKSAHKSGITRNMKLMLRYGAPLSVNLIIGGLLGQFISFMMAFFCSDLSIGNYQIALNFAVLMSFVTTPISTVLFPAFAKLNPQNDQHLLKTVFASSTKYASLLMVPVTLAIIVLSQPLVYTIFGTNYSYAPLFLTIYISGNLFVALGRLSADRVLIGQGETKMMMKQGLLAFALGIPLALILIPFFGIIGVIVSSLLAGIPSIFWGLHWVWKRYAVKAEFKSSIKIFASSTIAAITTYLSINFIAAADWVKLLMGGIVFLGIYVFAASLTGAVTQSEISNLKTMFAGMGIVSKLIDIPLFVMAKIDKSLQRTKSRFSKSSKEINS